MEVWIFIITGITESFVQTLGASFYCHGTDLATSLHTILDQHIVRLATRAIVIESTLCTTSIDIAAGLAGDVILPKIVDIAISAIRDIHYKSTVHAPRDVVRFAAPTHQRVPSNAPGAGCSAVAGAPSTVGCAGHAGVVAGD
jgi:hypothetical protein